MYPKPYGSRVRDQQPYRIPAAVVRYGILIVIVLAMLGLLIAVLVRQPDPDDAVTTLNAPAWCEQLLVELNPTIQTQDSCVSLRAADFADGTYVMDVPGACYVLLEDVDFAPNSAYDFMPRPSQPAYAGPAFRLGFFAAVVVRAPGVTLDLGGHTLRQSVAHRLQQRFFALVELVIPFVPGQGPADFGPLPEQPTSGFTLRNGRLGRSAHHGLHGNGAWDVVLRDLDIVDYEVAAVALNGAHRVLLERVRALGSATDVPVLGTYANARFLQPFVGAALLAHSAAAPSAAAALHAASLRLQTLMDQTLADVLATGRIDGTAHPEALALFDNAQGVIDGNAYGFLFHDRGVAVNGFACDRAVSATQHDILIVDCEVRGVVSRVSEVIALAEGTAVQLGPAGEVLRVEELLTEGGVYAGHALADTQIALAEFLAEAGQPSVGTLRVHPAVRDWALRNDTTTLGALLTNGTFAYLRNGDTMFHINKGVSGLRVDGGYRVAVLRTRIDGVRNSGPPGKLDPLWGETVEQAYYSGGADGGHPGQQPQGGYMGADARGVTVAAIANFWMQDCVVTNVASDWAWAHGVDVFNDAVDVGFANVIVAGVHSQVDTGEPLYARGPKLPRAVGFRVAIDGTERVTTRDLTISDVKSGHLGQAYERLDELTGIALCGDRPASDNGYGRS